MPPGTNEKIDMILDCLSRACSILRSLKIEDVAVPPNFARLMLKDAWPDAVSSLIDRDSDHERYRRAAAILDRRLERSIGGKRFLQLGCGLGDLVYAALGHDPEEAVGCDSVRGGWGRFPPDPRLILATEQPSGLFDAIFFRSPDANRAASLLAPGGLAYTRQTTATSRIGPGEVRGQKAFAHLYLGGYVPDDPLRRFADAGLKVRSAVPVITPVEPLFRTPLMRSRLMEVLGVGEFPEAILSITHVDYTLEAG